MTTRFRKGNRVRVKTWDQMREEFGERTLPGGHQVISTNPVFVGGMLGLCGKEFTIARVIAQDDIKLIDERGKDPCRVYTICADMLERVTQAPALKISISEQDFRTILGV